MTYVPPDGPVPCDLAIVGESPGKQEEVEGRGFCGPSGGLLWKRPDYENDLGLMEMIANRPRHTCYVSNVCKTPLPEHEWWRLTVAQREGYEQDIRQELDGVGAKVVLAFGVRAAKALVPEFGAMGKDHGKPCLGPTGKWIAMALYHPAAYLRGNVEALGAIASDLAKLDALFLDGLIEFLQPLPPVAPPSFPETIAFLTFKGMRKTAKCRLCSSKEVAAYEGGGLVWKLCLKHAIITAGWAPSHLEAIGQERDDALAAKQREKVRRASERMAREIGAANMAKEP